MWVKNILVEILNNVGHPTRCPQSLNSVLLTVSYIVQCLHNYFLKPTLCEGGVPATCVAISMLPISTTLALDNPLIIMISTTNSVSMV